MARVRGDAYELFLVQLRPLCEQPHGARRVVGVNFLRVPQLVPLAVAEYETEVSFLHTVDGFASLKDSHHARVTDDDFLLAALAADVNGTPLHRVRHVPFPAPVERL